MCKILKFFILLYNITENINRYLNLQLKRTRYSITLLDESFLIY